MEVFGEPTSRFEGENAAMPGAMIKDLHRPVLLNPQFTYDDVVHAAIHVAPSVRLTPPILNKFYY